MRFEARELKPYGNSVLLSELREGEVYFAVSYVDGPLVPIVETLIFVGRNLEPGDLNQVYFQDIASYRSGIRRENIAEGDVATFHSGADDELNHIFTFENALDELLRCSLRRRAQDPRSPPTTAPAS